MVFDFSGCGQSDDDSITTAHQVEDLRSVCAWLADRGYANQIVHAHSFGAVAALQARPVAVKTMVLSSPITGPLFFDWTEIFSPDQLDELEKHGATRIPDDSEGPRDWFIITRETLADLSLNESTKLLSDLDYPILIMFDSDDQELEIVNEAQNAFPLMPAGSRIHVEHNFHFSDPEENDKLVELSISWATRMVNPNVPKQRNPQ